MALISFIIITTHDAGATLDFRLSRKNSVAHFVMPHDLETGSDHNTHLANLLELGQELEPPRRLIHGAYDFEVFYNTLCDILK